MGFFIILSCFNPRVNELFTRENAGAISFSLQKGTPNFMNKIVYFSPSGTIENNPPVYRRAILKDAHHCQKISNDYFR